MELLQYDEIASPPKTLLDDLQQRMQKYKALCDQSRAENNDRKYRCFSD